MKQVKSVIINEHDCPFEDWVKEGRDGVRWRTLLGGDRTQSEAITMGIVEIDPGRPDVLHLHQHEPAEGYYVVSGQGYVSIDGKKTQLQPGSAVYVPSNSLHAIGNDGQDTLKVLYVFAVDSFEDVKYIFPAKST